jgi:hypothetical protein
MTHFGTSTVAKEIARTAAVSANCEEWLHTVLKRRKFKADYIVVGFVNVKQRARFGADRNH